MANDRAALVENNENAVPVIRSLKVLVVDSNSTTLAITCELLRSHGYTVITAGGGSEAIAIIRNNPSEVELILIDARLPDMDCLKLLRKIKKMSNFPVVVISSENNDDHMVRCLARGAQLFLVRPITSDEVKYLWQYSFVRKRSAAALAGQGQGGNGADGGDQVENGSSEEDDSSDGGQSDNEDGKRKGKTKQKKDDNTKAAPKKQKLFWNHDLQQRFLAAVWLLGIDASQPKKILNLMKVPFLTKENVSSHLQKHRLNLRRKKEAERNAILANGYHPSSSSSITAQRPWSTSPFLNPNISNASYPPASYFPFQKNLMSDPMSSSMPAFSPGGQFPMQVDPAGFNQPAGVLSQPAGFNQPAGVPSQLDKDLDDLLSKLASSTGDFPTDMDTNQSNTVPIFESGQVPQPNYQAGSSSYTNMPNQAGSSTIMCMDPTSFIHMGNQDSQRYIMQGNSQPQGLHQMPQLPLQEAGTFVQMGNPNPQGFLMQSEPLPAVVQDMELFDPSGDDIEELLNLIQEPQQSDDPSGLFHSGDMNMRTDEDDFHFP
ncbi:hypothetical protein Tsubulata_042206 [Turnera subulata]|uniref:Response regulatory domain-containing protein n=1 Tax=Turnera subulata TaxID=218843 RepID=A0A9Q0J9V5_9ROSI|nr:hypothetical protein Tsubulata_042206 [Turnera subulata]